MPRRRAEAEPAASERPRAGLLLDDLAEQLNRFRRLPGGSEADAERVLAGLTPASAREREATNELADRQILAHPERFEDAHHLLVNALEVFDRHAWPQPRLPRSLCVLRGCRALRRPRWRFPLRPLGVAAVEQVTRVIVRSYARTISNTLRR